MRPKATIAHVVRIRFVRVGAGALISKQNLTINFGKDVETSTALISRAAMRE